MKISGGIAVFVTTGGAGFNHIRMVTVAEA